MESQNGTHAQVKEYYGETLKSAKDLKTSACCSLETLRPTVRSVLADIHPEVLERFYGCGSPIPLATDGITALDLGCGTGRDTFILSKLVGSEGTVFGIDMTEEQIGIAQSHTEYHARKFGYQTSNVEFRRGYIEDLAGAGIADNTVDLVISNCVINLSPDKEAVFREALRVLRPGGELFFSDIFADRRISPQLQADPVLRGECLSGALYIEDFRRMLAKLGVLDIRVISSRPLTIDSPAVAERIGMVQFTSQTIRIFKLPLEDRCEDFGQVATYRGTIAEAPHRFELDNHHTFETGKPHLVCGNTAAMLSQSRFAPHFVVAGDTENHFGLFDCSNKQEVVQSGKSICC